MSNNGDTGISGWVNQNSNLIIDKIISDHTVFSELKNLGSPVRKSIVIRAGLILFLEDLSVLKKIPNIIQRVTNRISTDKILAEICLNVLPKTRITLKSRTDNHQTTISTQITAESLKIVDAIISSSKILKNLFQNLEEQGSIPNQRISNLKSIILRAALCYFLNQLDNLQKNPSWYQRAVTLQSSEKALQKIYTEKFGGPKN